MAVLGTTQNNMPELPEVETIKNTLEHLLKDRLILDVKILREKNILNNPSEFISSIKNTKICSLSRVGKYIIFHLSNGKVIISHLRMEGKYFIRENEKEFNKHDIAIFYLDANQYLAYNDTRKFGILKVMDEKNYLSEEPLNRVGPDPFMISDVSYLKNAFKDKNIPIKSALLDQNIMSGLGNIYVDEVLFDCKIHPETPAKMIREDQLDNILKSARKILKIAINKGGSTIKSYHPIEGVSGNFQTNLKIYGRKNEACYNCHHSLRKIFINGRGTTYCPNCQKNIALPYVAGVTGPIGSGKSQVGKYLLKKGYHYISADEIVHDLYSKKEVIIKLKKIIPGLPINSGKVDIEFLKNYLLENPQKKIKLEKYIHALVSDEIVRFIKSFNHDEKVVLDVPLLFESHIDDFCDFIIYVDVNKKNQIARLKLRNVDVKEYLKLNNSFQVVKNKKNSNVVIENNDSINDLYKKLDQINGI